MFVFFHAWALSQTARVCRAMLGIASILLLAHPAMASSSATTGRSSANETITIEGTAFSPLSGKLIEGAIIEFIDARTDRRIAGTISGAKGAYTIDLPFDGRPINAYIRGSADGYLTTLVFPPQPLTHDVGDCPPFVQTNDCMNVALLTDAQADRVAGAAGVERDPAKGEVLFLAAGCNGKPVAGATIRIAPKPETIAYTRGPIPNPSADATDSSGRVFGFNIQPGKATIVARYPDGSTGVTQVRIEASAVTIASTFPLNAHCSQ